MLADPQNQTIAALNLALIMQLMCVSLAVAFDPYIKKENRHRVYAIAALVLYLLVEPQISVRFGDTLYRSAPVFWWTLLSALSYIVRTLVLYFFIRMTGLTKGQRILYAVLAGNAVVCLSALFVPWVFYFDQNLRWHRGPLGFVPFAVSLLLNIWLVAGAIMKYHNKKRRENLAPVIMSVFVAVAVILDVSLSYDPPVSFLTVAMAESSVFFYIWLHLQFVREHEAALKAEQRIRIMVSQIQPHFLFNTLTTIQALTDIDPEKASEVIQKFAVYLRQNIDSLNRESLIPVKKEIEHTRIYSEIEEVRFPSIRISYEIGDDDFLLPPLTIQPMVENAIRHGVRGKKDGWVRISTFKDGTDHVITVRDNGKGFDVDQMIQETQKGDHIGVKNVRDRVIDMTGGTFSMESTVGEGTSITIRIPE